MNQNEEVNETIAPASTFDSSKKNKKDKLKKKWSFRSISFGKKDKQKPLKKTEESNVVTKKELVAAVADTNGESEKVPAEVGVFFIKESIKSYKLRMRKLSTAS